MRVGIFLQNRAFNKALVCRSLVNSLLQFTFLAVVAQVVDGFPYGVRCEKACVLAAKNGTFPWQGCIYLYLCEMLHEI
jgi:hypothetical protein